MAFLGLVTDAVPDRCDVEDGAEEPVAVNKNQSVNQSSIRLSIINQSVYIKILIAYKIEKGIRQWVHSRPLVSTGSFKAVT